ncbi:hypothetical protein AN214_00356 [Pseudoalteromonas sp. P1-9]|uniref:hypothetical protein n=1 Tax=Pseudoalteromonas sp. P1-9 TaxID=1710354 RepID=UPI0007075629|nr:hypothetical protein [Pseudoalteromonas sp. P1-9]KPV97970.1 hypothetical protein AN214_00356 [Pseudoalteromonas sp. P1-9]
MYVKTLLLATLFSISALYAGQTLDASQWRYAVDPHGSTASYEKPLVKEEYVGLLSTVYLALIHRIIRG